MTLSFCSLSAAQAQSTGVHTDREAKQKAVVAQIGQQQWQNISATISRDISTRQMHIQPPKAGKIHHHSENARHGWQAQYFPSGKTRLQLADGHYIAAQLVNWGYAGEKPQPIDKPTRITANKQQLDYHWSAALTERWTNTSAGTEQWFIVNKRPQRTADNATTSPLNLTLALNSDLAISQPDKQSLSFSGNGVQISYDKLKVWDSRGQLLSAAMQLNDDLLTLSVDDHNAVYPITIDPVFTTQQAYIKASNTNAGDVFGWSVALSADGNTLAVGAYLEDSDATGIGGEQANNDANKAGAVYIFTRTGTTWSQQTYIKASNTDANDWFGYSVALSADGNTLAVGAHLEDSDATGIDGDEANNSADGAGAVYVFTRTGTSWSHQAYIKASNTDVGDNFGFSVALSSEGNTLAVGAYFEDSNGNEANNSKSQAGAVYVFSRTGTTWSQQAYIKAANTDAYDSFGYSVALSADGNTLAVGAYQEDSSATGINGDKNDNGANSAGAVYIFTRTGTNWNQQAYIKASNTDADDYFGESVTLSADGNTLAVGATGEDSNATGINGDKDNNSTNDAGAVYVFNRTGIFWSQQAYIKASNTDKFDMFGTAVALSADGNTLVVGSPFESSSATGINGDDTNNSASDTGAMYVFSRTGTIWRHQTYIKASNTGENDQFGTAVALSADGNTLAVGAYLEDSIATGIGGNENDNGADDAGAVYVFIDGTTPGVVFSDSFE